MKPGEFIINGESSLDYNTFIQYKPMIRAPARRGSWKETNGRDGILPFSSGKYRNSTVELILYSEGDSNHREYENRSRLYDLFDQDGYSDFLSYFDPEKVWKVMLSEQEVMFENKYFYGDDQTWKVELSVYPWKYYIDQFEIHLTEPKTIFNKYIDVALPIIHIEGKGDIDLLFNGQEFRMKNIHSDGITLDCEIAKGFRTTPEGLMIDENSKLYTKRFPSIKPGENYISWEGDVSQIIIEPRWRAKV